MQKQIRILAKVPKFVPLIHLIEAPVTYLLWQTISCRHLKCPRMHIGNMVFQKFAVNVVSKMSEQFLLHTFLGSFQIWKTTTFRIFLVIFGSIG
jgi:hypothetical protein